VIIALLERGQQFGSIIKAAGTVVALGNAVQTSLTLEEQLTLARIAMSTETANVTHVVLGPPNVTAGWTEEGAWVYRGDPVAVKAFVQQVLAP
jgi:anionic cell wall polymer biosynthesis LytR-Cps2A-Psr (LCP) family protein